MLKVFNLSPSDILVGLKLSDFDSVVLVIVIVIVILIIIMIAQLKKNVNSRNF